MVEVQQYRTTGNRSCFYHLYCCGSPVVETLGVPQPFALARSTHTGTLDAGRGDVVTGDAEAAVSSLNQLLVPPGTLLGHRVYIF